MVTKAQPPLALATRRSVLLGAGLAAASAARAQPISPGSLPIPPGNSLAFRIMRHGSKIGEHHNVFRVSGDTLTVQGDAELVVRMLAVPVFRYVHHQVEHWQGGKFMALETKTNDDGTPFTLSVQRDAAGLTVNPSTIPRYVAPAEALPMTHWNRAEVKFPKINPQKGDLLRPAVTDLGQTQVQTVNGLIPAHRYNYRGDAILDVWWDENNNWASLAFLGGDQSQITLERM